MNLRSSPQEWVKVCASAFHIHFIRAPPSETRSPVHWLLQTEIAGYLEEMGNSSSQPAPGVPGSTEPNSVRVEVDVDQVERLSHTQGFDADEYLVTRRDTEFPLTLHSNSQPRVEEAKLVHASGSEIALKLGDQNVRRSGTVVKLTVPADAAVTVYRLVVSGKYEDGEAFQITLRRSVVVLFNAWSNNDGVFVENEEWREEYVLNSDGRVYAGDLDGMPWKLALYRPDSLRAVIWLLENVSNLNFKQKRDPILVSREMSALVNVQDENGVLVGRWDGEYTDGRPPTFWRGSGQILAQYYQSGGQPVRYGQCWVFSGVLLTVLRILGIPSRSITNFNSAHDTNRNRTIDQYYNEEGEKVRYLSSGSDSVW